MSSESEGPGRVESSGIPSSSLLRRLTGSLKGKAATIRGLIGGG